MAATIPYIIDFLENLINYLDDKYTISLGSKD